MPIYNLWELRSGGERIFLLEGEEMSHVKDLSTPERRRHFQKTWSCSAPSWSEANKLLEQELDHPTREKLVPLVKEVLVRENPQVAESKAKKQQVKRKP
uniref:Uncharacterized protein n=1 Tax=viral metagenome TaxID=1070528 RepID=A0A6M3X6S2_9ZZZZ